ATEADYLPQSYEVATGLGAYLYIHYTDVEIIRLNFQRSILAQLLKIESRYCCYRRQIKLDLVGFPQDPNAAIITDINVTAVNKKSIHISFELFYHLNRIIVNRTGTSFLSFYVSYSEIAGEQESVLQVHEQPWLTSSARWIFEFPVLLTPIHLTIHVTNGSLQPEEVSLWGVQANPCPPGFTPHGDICLHFGAVKALQSSAHRLCSSYFWAGGRGSLLMPKDAAVMSFLSVWPPVEGSSSQLDCAVSSGSPAMLAACDSIPPQARALPPPQVKVQVQQRAGGSIIKQLKESRHMMDGNDEVLLYALQGSRLQHHQRMMFFNCSSSGRRSLRPEDSLNRNDFEFHIGMQRNNSGWFWFDGTAVPNSHWKLGQPSEIYGVYSTMQASIVAHEAGTKEMFACQLPQAPQRNGEKVTMLVSHVAYADQRASFGGSYSRACVQQPDPGRNRYRRLLYDRLHLLEGSQSGFSTSSTQYSNSTVFACSVPPDLVGGARPAFNRRIVTVMPAERDCYRPLLGEGSGASVRGFPFSASYFDSAGSIIGSGVRMRVHDYEPWRSQPYSHNIAYFKTIYYNGQKVNIRGRTAQGFLRLVLNSVAPVVGTQVNSLLVDFKSLHLISGVDMETATRSQFGVRLLTSTVWQPALGGSAFDAWPQCGSVEVPILSSKLVVACVASEPSRYLAIVRRIEHGSPLSITALHVYGKEYYTLDENVQVRPEWMPRGVVAAAIPQQEVHFQARLKTTTLKIWLTDQYGYDKAMRNKRYIVKLTGNSSHIRLSGCTVEHKDYSYADFELTSLDSDFSDPVVFDTDDFANISVTWQQSKSAGSNLTIIRVFSNNQSLGSCWDSVYGIQVNKIGYSGLIQPYRRRKKRFVVESDSYTAGKMAPHLVFHELDNSSMGAFSPSLLAYLSDNPATTAVFVQAILPRRCRLFAVAIGGGAIVNQAGDNSNYVTSFRAAVSEEGKYWSLHRDGWILTGVFVAQHESRHRLLPEPVALGFRLYPLSWTRKLEFKWQLLGCSDSANAIANPILLSRYRPTGSNSDAATGLPVDGNFESHALSGRCFQHSGTADPYLYWFVDLGVAQRIVFIFIVDMVETLDKVQALSEDMQSASVYISNSTAAPWDATAVTILETWTGGFMKSHLWKINVNKVASVAGLRKHSSLGTLSLCEFEVYGYPSIAAYYFINSNVGLEDGRIMANQLSVGDATAASPQDAFRHPTPLMAALNRGQEVGLPPAAVFSDSATDGSFLEIQLDVIHRITGIVWQGSGVWDFATGGFDGYVTTARIRYGNSSTEMLNYTEYSAGGLSHIIRTGLTGNEMATRMSFTKPFLARVVRILPIRFVRKRLLRLELLGYPEDCDWVSSAVLTITQTSPTTVQVQLATAHLLTGWRLNGLSENATFVVSYASPVDESVRPVTLHGSA
uniref:F5/8 type C domain-containing protein n=2 Tax=Macrostomum lignano TaxID=282301 RepID=A0A1I8FRG4_9PLAT